MMNLVAMPAPLHDDHDELRWRSVLTRDRAADGAFFYAVATTGVFCRPTCSARRPRRENVRFFDTPHDAERAGFRACLRCKPLGARPSTPHAAAVARACTLLAAPERARSEDVAAAVGLSPFQLSRAFKQQLGVTPQAYRRRALAERAKSTLTTSSTVTQAVYGSGYSASSRFYASAAPELGMPARVARLGAAGVDVAYTTRPCALGVLLVGWTERGVCDVRFGDSAAEVQAALAARFPRATHRLTDAHGWVDAVLAAADAPRSVDVPLDVQGTAFQQRVWQALRTIPAGETRTYAELTVACGLPSASVRAVAGACAANSIAVLVPCHRVVRQGGALAGYRWGVDRKRALLDRER